MFGDIGIYRLFQKIALSLKPKGHLILEPHTWKSYKKKKYFSNYYTSQYKKITFRPNLFNLYLLESLSLKLVETISPMESIEGQTRKIIYIFQKIWFFMCKFSKKKISCHTLHNFLPCLRQNYPLELHGLGKFCLHGSTSGSQWATWKPHWPTSQQWCYWKSLVLEQVVCTTLKHQKGWTNQ